MKDLFSVIVTHNSKCTNTLVDKISNIIAIDQNNCICIDTANNKGLLEDNSINSAFEFSGYQYGLQKVIDDVTHRGYPESNLVSIVFMNDTAMTAHVPGLFRLFSRIVIKTLKKEPEMQAVIGVGQRCGFPQNELAVAGYYFPTYLFALRATISNFRKTLFYDSKITSPSAVDNIYVLLPKPLQHSIDLWLNPTKFTCGWYKASPFSKTDPQTIYRKKMTIYLELSLPSRMSDQGYKLRNVAADSNCVKFALLVDRIYVNIIKLKYRTRILFNSLIKTLE